MLIPTIFTLFLSMSLSIRKLCLLLNSVRPMLFPFLSCLYLFLCAARSWFAVIVASYIGMIKPIVVICVSVAFAIALHTNATALLLNQA